MTRKIVMDFAGWGVILWFFGYALGIVAFFFMPPEKIGWFVMPLMLIGTVWVLGNQTDAYATGMSVLLGLTWTLLAAVGDYFFIVRLFNPPDGYYKMDVYVYYLLTLILPIVVSAYRRRNLEG